MNESTQQMPPVISAQQFSANYTIAGIIVSVGTLQPIFENGAQVPTLGVDWGISIAVSPPSAKALMRLLVSMVDQYERNYGAIPEPATPLINGEHKPVDFDGQVLDNVTPINSEAAPPKPSLWPFRP